MKQPANETARSGGLSRFLRLGMADARERLARLTAHEPPNDAGLVAVVEASAVVRGVSRVVDVVRLAGRSSVLLGMVGAARRAWLRQSLVDRTRRAGVALISAAAMHLALVFWQGPLTGWLWLVVPALAGALGGLMVLAPARGLVREVRR